MQHKNRVADFRAARGISQADLAVAAKITRTHVSNIERGLHTPSVEIAKRICAVLGASLDEVFGGGLSEVLNRVS